MGAVLFAALSSVLFARARKWKISWKTPLSMLSVPTALLVIIILILFQYVLLTGGMVEFYYWLSRHRLLFT